MRYQLVLQWPPNSSRMDFDRLISFEDAIEDGMGELGILDGHDIGSGEMNLFIHTNLPQEAFEKALSLLGDEAKQGGLKAGYRDFNEEEYVPIYPKGLDHFSVL
jgi:hypothetical protein